MKQILIRCKGTSTLPLDSLQNLQGNLKKLMESEYKKLRRSIEKYGFRFPIFVWGNHILDGHQRILVIKKMVSEGWSINSIPIVEIEAENEREAKHLVLLVSSRYGHVTDDGLYEFIMTSELDFNELKEEIDLPEIDFKQFEESYFTEEPKDADPQIDRAEELNKKWQVAMGDLWQIGEHRLLCGDSTKAEDLARVMSGEKAGGIVTDPPYGIGYAYALYNDRDSEKNDALIRAVFSIGPEIKVWTPGLMNLARELAYFPKAKILCWHKGFSQAGNGIGGASTWEPVLCTGVVGGTLPNDYFDFSTDREPGLRDKPPCPKPVALFVHLIQHLVGDLNIYDPFLGSGTTMVACQNLNRKCRGIEIFPPYCAVTLERMATAFPRIEIKRINGERSRT